VAAAGRGLGNLPWNNDDLTLFHGCTSRSLRLQDPQGIEVGRLPHGIDLSKGGTRRDFGPGFYTTTWLRQAKNWANIKMRQLRGRRPSAQAVVLRFAMKGDDLALLETLVFTNDEGDFYPFVGYCRRGGRPHARAPTRQNPYDVIYGPVCLVGQTQTMKDSDQISFHTVRATDMIPVVTVEATGNPLFDDVIP
jgi:hypothetical protein